MKTICTVNSNFDPQTLDKEFVKKFINTCAFIDNVFETPITYFTIHHTKYHMHYALADFLKPYGWVMCGSPITHENGGYGFNVLYSAFKWEGNSKTR